MQVFCKLFRHALNGLIAGLVAMPAPSAVAQTRMLADDATPSGPWNMVEIDPGTGTTSVIGPLGDAMRLDLAYDTRTRTV